MKSIGQKFYERLRLVLHGYSWSDWQDLPKKVRDAYNDAAALIRRT